MRQKAGLSPNALRVPPLATMDPYARLGRPGVGPGRRRSGAEGPVAMRETVHRTATGPTIRAATRSIAALLVGMLTLALLTTAPAAASTRTARGTSCDPAYGCSPPPPTGGLTPTCTVSATAAHRGDLVSATLTNVPVGIHVRLLFDGQQVAEGDTVATGTTGSITLTFAVPANASAGSHTLVFAGAGVQCDPLGTAGFGVQVEGEQILARGDTGGSGNSGGSLARTGVQIALLLAVAIVLFLLGSAAVRAARRRRRRLERARERERQRHRLRV